MKKEMHCLFSQELLFLKNINQSKINDRTSDSEQYEEQENYGVKILMPTIS